MATIGRGSSEEDVQKEIEAIRERYLQRVPKLQTVWQHHSGRRYVVDRITNLATLYDEDQERVSKFPISVTYYQEGYGDKPTAWFSRPVQEFLTSCKPV